MKNVSAYFEKRITPMRKAIVASLFFLLALALPSGAQSEQASSSAVLFENPLTYLYIIIFVLVSVVIYSVFNAKRVLEQNGKSMDVPLPSLRWMAGHGKIVAAFFLLVILAAILWAVRF